MADCFAGHATSSVTVFKAFLELPMRTDLVIVEESVSKGNQCEKKEPPLLTSARLQLLQFRLHLLPTG